MYTVGPIQILARPGGIPTVIVDTAAVILLPGNIRNMAAGMVVAWQQLHGRPELYLETKL